MSLFNQFFQKPDSQLFVIQDPTCFNGLNVTRKCEPLITQQSGMVVVVPGVILIFFTKDFLIVIVVDIRARSWLDLNDLFIFTTFQHQRLLFVHLQRLEWIEFQVIFETLVLYQLMKHVFYVVIRNCVRFGHVNQY